MAFKAGALDQRYRAAAHLRRDAHDLAYLGGHRRSAGCTGIDRGRSLGHCSRIAGTSREAAAPAVGAGQALRNGLFPRILLYMKNFGCKCQYQAEDSAQYTEHHNGNDDSIHFSPRPLTHKFEDVQAGEAHKRQGD